MADGTRHRRLDALLTPRSAAVLTVECRRGVVGPGGALPELAAAAWDGTSLWLYSIVRSRRWADLRSDPRVAVVVDDGTEYGDLRGVELSGTVEFVGEAPRPGEPHPGLEAVERLFAAKNFGLESMPHDGRHAWLRLTPDAVVSWDFRKMPDPG
ncbi:pyridoxamine 5'-phosphate oxidase family protein [Actinacidiphila glaucinigra]|uniref:pyridoxamine 5'-phosphate oxidase family protein n=1 Tax=Actinacidiphila glaucinigra TaxID=235986 RepID=UPI0036D020C5